MKNLRNPVVGSIIFAILIGLCVLIYNGVQDSYNTTEDYYQYSNVTGKNDTIVNHLATLDIFETMKDFKVAVQDITNPQNPLDLLGGLAGAGIGILKFVWNVVTFPLEIMNIILAFYEIPSIIIIGLDLIIVIYVAFIFLSAYTRGDL